MLHHIARVLRLTQFFALLLVIGMGVVLYSTLDQFEKAGRWVEHTHEVIDQIELVRLESMRAGIWLRNFAVKPNVEWLERVRSSAGRAHQAAQRLVDLTTDNAAQRQHLQHLEMEVSKVMGHYLDAAGIAERKGQAALQPLVVERVSADSTRELRRLLDEAEGAERELLQARSEAQRGRLVVFKKLLASAGVVFAAVMLWAIRYSSRLLRAGHDQVRRMESDALCDPLTGLLNRRGLEEQLARVDDRLHGTGMGMGTDQRVAVLAFDLDGFKPVNDRHGHATGDRVLREVARRLQQGCRESDAIARMGGDEFIVVLPCFGRHEATAAAQRLRARLTAPIALDGAQLCIGASIGVALLHEDGDDMEALLRCADAQMYAEKKAGKAATEADSATTAMPA